MAEKQNDHRIKQEATVIEFDIKRQNRGLYLGFVVAIVGLVVSYFIGRDANAVAGVIVAGLDIGGLVTSFLYGTISRRSEREDRAKIMTGRF